MHQVLLAAPVSDSFRRFLHDKGCSLLPYEEHPETSELTGIITSNKLQLDEQALNKFPRLQWIARLGSGMEIIDTAACDRRGIRYISSPAGIANSVGEHTLGMLLGLLHHIPRSFNEIKQGHWIREANRGHELSQRCVGLIGYGHTGTAVAGKLKAFTSNIVVYDKYKSGFGDAMVREVGLEELQEKADILSFHVPLNTETRHYYNHDFMNRMVKPHILVNVSRGAVCHTPVILDGLASGKISGACLDVLEEEADMTTILQTHNNLIQQLLPYPVVLTPHIAGYSHEAIENMSRELMQQLEEWL